MNTADMMIHVQPSLDIQARAVLEKQLLGRVGVDCAEFNHSPHPFALMVKYDPDEVEGMELLQMVRRTDPAAFMVGL
ncbi:MAG: hypothetical protein HZB95_03075 [Nitrosomonadales bacterium]|nr:hypothetical protein [Nitrosomonadales bacterium]